MFTFYGYSNGDLYCYGMDMILTVNGYEYFEGFAVYIYSKEINFDYSRNPVKFIEADHLSGSARSFSSSFSGQVTLKMHTKDYGTESQSMEITGTFDGVIKPDGAVEAMSGVFLNCREFSYDLNLTFVEIQESITLPEHSYLAPAVGKVRGAVYESDDDGIPHYRGDAALISGIAGGKTISPVDVYTLTVNSGDGDGTLYTNGQQVAISADVPPTGQMFDCWTGATQYVANATNSSTTVTMPGQNITVTATYKEILQVSDAAGEGGSVSPDVEHLVGFGGSLTLTADPDGGYKFKYWRVDGEITAAGETTLTLENITVDITVEAIFEKVKAMPWLQLLLE